LAGWRGTRPLFVTSSRCPQWDSDAPERLSTEQSSPCLSFPSWKTGVKFSRQTLWDTARPVWRPPELTWPGRQGPQELVPATCPVSEATQVLATQASVSLWADGTGQPGRSVASLVCLAWGPQGPVSPGQSSHPSRLALLGLSGTLSAGGPGNVEAMAGSFLASSLCPPALALAELEQVRRLLPQGLCTAARAVQPLQTFLSVPAWLFPPLL
jgi:hypothetical protein